MNQYTFGRFLKKFWWVYVLGAIKTYVKVTEGDYPVIVVPLALLFALLGNYIVYLGWRWWKQRGDRKLMESVAGRTGRTPCWQSTDPKGFNAALFFDPTPFEFLVKVTAPSGKTREEKFKAYHEPTFGIDTIDMTNTLEIAERITGDLEKEITAG